jgi:hypothetical protein
LVGYCRLWRWFKTTTYSLGVLFVFSVWLTVLIWCPKSQWLFWKVVVATTRRSHCQYSKCRWSQLRVATLGGIPEFRSSSRLWYHQTAATATTAVDNASIIVHPLLVCTNTSRLRVGTSTVQRCGEFQVRTSSLVLHGRYRYTVPGMVSGSRDYSGKGQSVRQEIPKTGPGRGTGVDILRGEWIEQNWKRRLAQNCSFDNNSYENDVERKKRGISWRGKSNSPKYQNSTILNP